MPRLTPREMARRLAAYDRELRRIVARGLRLQASDVRRIGRRFAAFRREALAVLPDRSRLDQLAIRSVVERVAVELERLGASLEPIIRGGIAEQQALAQDLAEAYARAFLPEGAAPSFVGLPPQAVDLVADFSAELVGLSHGGLGQRMLAEVNRVLRLSALGAGGGSFNASAAISQALGGAKRWSWQAERIYRTEVLRAHSLVTEQSIRRLNQRTPTSKRWIWSGIERAEHRAIDGQTVPAAGSFVVPLREGGSVRMLHPRDGGAPPSATANCGCYVVPWPGPSTARRAA